MTNISNPFAPNGRHLLSTYTISTPQSVDIADNQKGYGCILKFTRFRKVKKERRVNAFIMFCRPTRFVPDRGLCVGGLHPQIYELFLNLNVFAQNLNQVVCNFKKYTSDNSQRTPPPRFPKKRPLTC